MPHCVIFRYTIIYFADSVKYNYGHKWFMSLCVAEKDLLTVIKYIVFM